MKFEKTQVMNFENAFRGLRNPKNSWERSDSRFGLISITDDIALNEVADKWMEYEYSDSALDSSDEFYKRAKERIKCWLVGEGIIRESFDQSIIEVAYIGPNDMKLAQQLIKAGPEHRKFLRQIFVSVDITAPLYLWKELDTYKVGTTANSTSTMHKITSKPITLDCFEIGDYQPDLPIFSTDENDTVDYLKTQVEDIIAFCELLRQRYLSTQDKRYWKELIRWLPESWLQTRTWTCNYETLLSIAHQRNSHKLTEWFIDFMRWLIELPYANEFIFNNETKKTI